MNPTLPALSVHWLALTTLTNTTLPALWSTIDFHHFDGHDSTSTFITDWLTLFWWTRLYQHFDHRLVFTFFTDTTLPAHWSLIGFHLFDVQDFTSTDHWLAFTSLMDMTLPALWSLIGFHLFDRHDSTITLITDWLTLLWRTWLYQLSLFLDWLSPIWQTRLYQHSDYWLAHSTLTNPTLPALWLLIGSLNFDEPDSTSTLITDWLTRFWQTRLYQHSYHQLAFTSLTDTTLPALWSLIGLLNFD